MARYGTLIAWAKTSGHSEVITLLRVTLVAEKKAASLPSQSATQDINVQAAKAA